MIRRLRHLNRVDRQLHIDVAFDPVTAKRVGEFSEGVVTTWCPL